MRSSALTSKVLICLLLICLAACSRSPVRELPTPTTAAANPITPFSKTQPVDQPAVQTRAAPTPSAAATLTPSATVQAGTDEPPAMPPFHFTPIIAPGAVDETAAPTATASPIRYNAIAFAPTGGAVYRSNGVGVDRFQDGQAVPLYAWPETVTQSLAVFSADGQILAERLKNGDIVLVDLTQGSRLRTFRSGVDYQAWPMRLALTRDGSKLALAVGENTVQIWTVQTGQKITTLTQPGDGVTYQSLAFSPDGKFLAGGFMSRVALWEINTNTSRWIQPGCRSETVFDLAYSPDGTQLAIVCGSESSSTGFLAVWSVADHQPVTLKDEIRQMQRLAFSPDGAWLAAGGPDGALMLWDARLDKETIIYQAGVASVRDLVFSPDGKSLAVVTETQTVVLSVSEKFH